MRSAIFTLLFTLYAYFYQAGGWNQNSRFDLVRAVTNDHAVRIDPYQRNTGDKALYDGHYYSDKAPNLALAAERKAVQASVRLERYFLPIIQTRAQDRAELEPAGAKSSL